jgi:hypothetical protein
VAQSSPVTWAAVVIALLGLTPARAFAHCDGLDGPVVKAAQRALETRNPALALIWVQEKDEREIQNAFDQALAVRELSPQAKALADRFFFETLVRVHRAGEGAPFTGLKPAGRDLGPLFRRPTKRFVLARWSPFGSCSRTPCSTGSVKSSRR